MTNFFEKLTIAVATGGNCVNLGRSLASTDPDLIMKIIKYDMEHNIPATGAYVLERYYATLPR